MYTVQCTVYISKPMIMIIMTMMIPSQEKSISSSSGSGDNRSAAGPTPAATRLVGSLPLAATVNSASVSGAKPTPQLPLDKSGPPAAAAAGTINRSHWTLEIGFKLSRKIYCYISFEYLS